MNWLQALYDTYNANSHLVGRIFENDKDTPLLPIYHTTQNAHIEVAINGNGEFLRASVVPKPDLRTIIPCTEQSGGSRTGTKPINHPLSDKLQYVAGDFVKYGGVVTRGFSQRPEEPYEMYLNDLKKWAESDYTHPKIRAIYQYVCKGCLIEDLVSSKVLYVDENQKLINKWEGKEKPPIYEVLGDRRVDKSVVRWIVEIPGDLEPATWKDTSLYQSWISYMETTVKKTGFCFVTGKETKLATSHPAKIRHDADSAKLISSNDTSGFTFRGRFLAADQAVGVSLEVTQKAHAVLQWLVRRQGFQFGDLAIVCWTPKGERIPDPWADTATLLGYIPVVENDDSEVDSSAYVGEALAHRLNAKILGYKKVLDVNSHVLVMALDSASPGRMSIAFYRHLAGSEFLDRIEHWHRTCIWTHRFKSPLWNVSGKAKVIEYEGAPSLYDIVDAVYGSGADAKVRQKLLQRLLPCVIDGKAIPLDIVNNAVKRATKRVALDPNEWEKTLTIACAVYNKAYEKEGYTVALEENRTTRDYLYGRLLALAENIEEWALSEAGESRPTNAARMMQRFADRPYSTWRMLELALAPYKMRLGGKVKAREMIIQEVMDLFNPDDFTSDKPLSGEFLLGYHCQKRALYVKQKKEQNSEEESK